MAHVYMYIIKNLVSPLKTKIHLNQNKSLTLNSQCQADRFTLYRDTVGVCRGNHMICVTNCVRGT
jgi:hypothetical protein